MDATQEKYHFASTYQVRDPFTLLITVLLLIVLIAISALTDLMIYLTSKQGLIPWHLLFTPEYAWQSGFSIGANIITILVFLRLKALWCGVVVTVDNGTVTFPGGSVSANDFIDYFKPSFLLQYFLRKSVNLDQIRQISQSTKRKVRTRNGNVIVTKLHSINMNGGFGAVSIWFKDEGKCDEIYSAIRQLNNMGEPFIRA